jgi:hypothetical protein
MQFVSETIVERDGMSFDDQIKNIFSILAIKCVELSIYSKIGNIIPIYFSSKTIETRKNCNEEPACGISSTTRSTDH